MYSKTIITMIAASMFFAAPAFAKKGSKCKDKDVVGSYTRVITYAFEDDFGNDIDRTTVRQLSLNEGGVAHQAQTDSLDGALNNSARTEWNGSWACQKDGSLVVTMMLGILIGVPPEYYGPEEINGDLDLIANQKVTYRFTVASKDMLTLTEAVLRNYFMTEDPLDPAAGTRSGIFSSAAPYYRLKASDADLQP